MELVTKDMTIGDIVEKYPEAAEIMTKHGLHCIGCHANPYETLEQGSLGHGMSEEEFGMMFEELNNFVKKSDEPVEKGDIIITEIAAEKVKAIMAKQGKPDVMLRVAVVPGGCSGFTYSMDLVEAKKTSDFVFDKNGLTVLVDQQSMKKLDGVQIDYIEDLQGSGFKIENPQAEKSCGCGKSFH